MIDYSKFKKSLLQLQKQFANLQSLDQRQGLSPLDQEAIAESVIQRFETCYDCIWKILKRHLNEKLGLPDLPNSPKPIFRIAADNQLLINSDAQWLIYAEARVQTAHDYDGLKAASTLALMPAFVADAVALYQTLTGESWG
jgi:nucleotidyltransferase substrate binding protein (TIGR01987 family)